MASFAGRMTPSCQALIANSRICWSADKGGWQYVLMTALLVLCPRRSRDDQGLQIFRAVIAKQSVTKLGDLNVVLIYRLSCMRGRRTYGQVQRVSGRHSQRLCRYYYPRAERAPYIDSRLATMGKHAKGQTCKPKMSFHMLLGCKNIVRRKIFIGCSRAHV